ncbi:MAG: right-handed parallel beta-helix repeat-containing protein [Verrucomicrobia bacterium]|nr:right-handed parallel beta-helix repeat-containing protein [Verrucomicrobiota bacterium]
MFPLGGVAVGAGLVAATIHVRVDGDDTRSGVDWETAVQTVNRAVALAADGDELWVAQGTYTERLTVTKGLALYGGFAGHESSRAERQPAVYRTILDGAYGGVVVSLRGSGPPRVVDGFTIQQGRGAGITCQETAFVIRGNVIRANLYSETLGYGGGIHVNYTPTNLTAVIEANVIQDNYTLDGGGIACIDASPHITGNWILWNTAAQNGGISCWRNASPRITHNLILGNMASLKDEGMAVPVGGGGIFATADDLDGRPHPHRGQFAGLVQQRDCGQRRAEWRRDCPDRRQRRCARGGQQHRGGQQRVRHSLGQFATGPDCARPAQQPRRVQPLGTGASRRHAHQRGDRVQLRLRQSRPLPGRRLPGIALAGGTER